MKSKLRVSTVIMCFLAAFEHITLLYLAGAKIVIEANYPSDTPFSPEIYYAFVAAVIVSIVSAIAMFNSVRLSFPSHFDDSVDRALRWTFVAMFVSLPMGNLMAIPTLFLASPLAVMLAFKFANYLAKRKASQ